MKGEGGLLPPLMPPVRVREVDACANRLGNGSTFTHFEETGVMVVGDEGRERLVATPSPSSSEYPESISVPVLSETGIHSFRSRGLAAQVVEVRGWWKLEQDRGCARHDSNRDLQSKRESCCFQSDR